MTDIEIILLPLLAKGLFVLVSALCIAAILVELMTRQGWRGAIRPLALWLAWCLLTLLGMFLVMVLANAHTHVAQATLLIRAIALVYVLAGTALVVHLVRRLRAGRAEGTD